MNFFYYIVSRIVSFEFGVFSWRNIWFSFFLLSFSSSVLAFSPTEENIELAKKWQEIIEKISTQSASPVKVQQKFLNRITTLRSEWVTKNFSPDKLFFLENIYRNLGDVDSFSTDTIIYDERDSIIWNHAPKGFDVLYEPFDTPQFGLFDPLEKYRVLVNGGYFNRVEWSRYHAGILAIDGERYTPMVYGDPQVTHFFCELSDGEIQILPNQFYDDYYIPLCKKLFQAWPLVFQWNAEDFEENLAKNAYIGGKHKRTVMVIFEKNDVQDVWLLTINEEVNFSRLKELVFMETRFINTYDAVTIFNLDGGSSVAHMNKSYPELNIGRTKTLPIVFGIY